MKRHSIRLVLLILVIGLAACGVAPTNPGDFFVYTTVSGDTVSQIAAKYHITIEQIINLNSNNYPELARDPSKIQPGWKLLLPKITTQATVDTTQADLNQTALSIVDQINNARAQKGLVLLRNDTALARFANDRNVDMIKRNYFDHYDPETGQEPLLRYLQAAKFNYRYAGENIAEIKNDAGWVPPWLTVAARYSATELANQFVQGWLNSSEHRANIFSANYHRTGVALAVSADGRRIVATQVFSD